MSRWALLSVTIRADVGCSSTTGILHAYNYIAMNGNTSLWVTFYNEQLNRIARELNINLRGTDDYSQRRSTTYCRGCPPPTQNTPEKTNPINCNVPLSFVKFDLKINLVFKPRMHTNGKLAVCFFSESHAHFCIFSDLLYAGFPIVGQHRVKTSRKYS